MYVIHGRHYELIKNYKSLRLVDGASAELYLSEREVDIALEMN